MKAEHREIIEDICKFLNFSDGGASEERNKDRLLLLSIQAGIIQAAWAYNPGKDPLKVFVGFEPKEKDRLYKKILKIHSEALEFVKWLLDNLNNEKYFLLFNTSCRISWGASEKSEFDLFPFPPDYETIEVEAYPAGTAMPGQAVKTFKLPNPFAFLLFALDGRRKTAIQSCERCGKIFFNNSDRNVRFCGTRCQSATRVKRMRDKQRKEG